MIQESYYQRFTTLCKRNPKITQIPTKDELEKTGCKLSGMSYLIEPDGRQCNPLTVNPEILSDGVRVLFNGSTTVPAHESTPTHIETKQCSKCGEHKSTDMFRKKANKIPTWFDMCKSCQVIDRTIESDITEHPIADTKTTAYVHIDRVRELVTEAYAMGRHDEQRGIEIIEPTVRELLGLEQC